MSGPAPERPFQGPSKGLNLGKDSLRPPKHRPSPESESELSDAPEEAPMARITRSTTKKDHVEIRKATNDNEEEGILSGEMYKKTRTEEHPPPTLRQLSDGALHEAFEEEKQQQIRKSDNHDVVIHDTEMESPPPRSMEKNKRKDRDITQHDEDEDMDQEDSASRSIDNNNDVTRHENTARIEREPAILTDREILDAIYEELKAFRKENRQMAQRITRHEAQIELSSARQETPATPETEVTDAVNEFRQQQRQVAINTIILRQSNPPTRRETPAIAGPANGAENANATKKYWAQMANSKDKEWDNGFITGSRANDRRRIRQSERKTAEVKASLAPKDRSKDPRHRHKGKQFS
ncbi:hypothetical protein FPQ18DRAFT_310822 [Pyronema domesticum]|nr:hypothetical protein FPQ18DRAFT_310822 [Pyronema domesticum]